MLQEHSTTKMLLVEKLIFPFLKDIKNYLCAAAGLCWVLFLFCFCFSFACVFYMQLCISEADPDTPAAIFSP